MSDFTEYPGCGMHESLENGKTAGQLFLSADSLRFQWEKGNIEFPFQGLSVKRGGSSGHLVFFEHPAHPGWMLYTEKKSILNRLQGVPDFAQRDIAGQVKDIKSSNRRITAIILVCLLVTVAFFYGLYMLRNPINKAIANKIPVEWETSLGETVFEGYKGAGIMVDGAEVTAALQTFTAPLMESLPDKRYAFRVHVFQDPTINAFALPGGFVVLNTGLITAAESAEEVLGVLAHEVAHVTLRHGMRKMIDSLGMLLLVKAILGDASGLWGAVVENGAFLLNQKFSRGFEKEADETGFAYLVNAGINPTGMIGFFQRLRDLGREAGTASMEEALDFLSTHPAPATRMKYLERKWQQLESKGHFIDLSGDFRAFQAAVKTWSETHRDQARPKAP